MPVSGDGMPAHCVQEDVTSTNENENVSGETLEKQSRTFIIFTKQIPNMQIFINSSNNFIIFSRFVDIYHYCKINHLRKLTHCVATSYNINFHIVVRCIVILFHM